MASGEGAGGPRRSVLVVDDDADVRRMVVWQLETEGFAMLEAGDGETALATMRERAPDLVILDLSLPGISGLEVLGRLRDSTAIPVILLTGRGAEADRVAGLDLGADDYLVKPFSLRELGARVRSVLRRTSPAPAVAAGALDFGCLRIDPDSRDVTIDGRPVELTAKEFDLLVFLARSPRRVFTRAQLLEQVWGSSAEWQDEATVTQHVFRLRGKLGDDRDDLPRLRTVRGVGYRFEPS
jgi:two-component system phosphate regulon response regulator PhoB